jgi:hypothetical protein
MATTSSFGFTNVTENSNASLSITDLKPVTNYGISDTTATVAELSNTTAPLGQGELVSYMFAKLNKISTKQTIYNPGKVNEGVQYVIRLDEILRTTDSTDPNMVVDDPIVMQLTVRHTMSGNVTSSHIKSLLGRLVGACFKSDGTTRFDDLMRNALNPRVD